MYRSTLDALKVFAIPFARRTVAGKNPPWFDPITHHVLGGLLH